MSDNDQRKNLKKDTWIIVLAIFFVAVLIFTNYGESYEVIYDCRDAHWHPDVPIEVRTECKKIMRERLEELRKEERAKKYIST